MLHLDTRAVRLAQDDNSTRHQREPEAVTRLRPLLAAAAELDPQDREGWIRLRRVARLTTAGLVAGGALPGHLAVGPDDAPALVARTVAAAWRHATSAPSRQEGP